MLTVEGVKWGDATCSPPSDNRAEEACDDSNGDAYSEDEWGDLDKPFESDQ
jgi:hypothetical protein